jgi:hypothetical protein
MEHPSIHLLVRVVIDLILIRSSSQLRLDAKASQYDSARAEHPAPLGGERVNESSRDSAIWTSQLIKMPEKKITKGIRYL